MNDTIKTIYERRAVRKYKDIEIDRDVINDLLAAGRMAPSAMNKQPWRFYVLTDQKKIRLLSGQITKIALKQLKRLSLKEVVNITLSMFHFSKVVDYIKSEDHVFYNAPVVIFITSQVSDEWGALDVGMCAQNIMLAARSMGMDTCPIGFSRFVMQTKDYHLLNIPETEKVELGLIVGYGDEHPKAHERIQDNVMYV